MTSVNKFFTKQLECYNFYKNDSRLFYVAKQYSYINDVKKECYGFSYNAYSTLKDFIKYSKKLSYKDRNLYEQIKYECTEYYDIDGDINIEYYKNTSYNNIIKDFLNMRTEWGKVNTYDNSDIDIEKDVFVLVSTNPEQKKSIHITIRNGFVFKSTLDHKKYATDFEKFLENKDCPIKIDKSVYNTSSNFRTIGQHKIGSDRVLIRSDFNKLSLECDEELFYNSNVSPEIDNVNTTGFISKQTFESSKEFESYKSFVLNFVNVEQETKRVKIKKEDITKLLKCDVLKLIELLAKNIDEGTHYLCDKETKNKVVYDVWKNIVFASMNSLSNEEEQETAFTILFPLYRNNKNLSFNQELKAFTNNSENYDGMNISCLHSWCRELPEYKELFNDIVDTVNELIPKQKSYSDIKKITKKRRTDEEQQKLEDINDSVLNKQINSLFIYNENQYIKKEIVPDSVEFVQDITFPEGFRCIGLHAGLGRGKTSSIIRYIKTLPKNAKVLVLSPRITFTENICVEYNEKLAKDEQFVNYISWRKSGKKQKLLNFENKVIISMEGLHYMEGFQPDLLIIDECNANLISHVSIETNGKNIDTNMYQLKRFLDYSKKVIVADAFLGSKVCNFFTDLQIPLFVYKYLRKLERKDAVFLPPLDKEVLKELKSKYTGEELEKKLYDEDPIVKKMEKLLSENKKVYSFFSTKTKLESIERGFSKRYDCLFYSGVSQNKIPDNLNDEWSKKDLIGTTCTITVGINHDRKNVFNTKIIDFSSSSKNYVSDSIQSHYRVRHIIDNEIYVQVRDNHIASNYPINIDKLEEQMKHKFNWYQNTNKCFQNIPDYIRNLIKHNYIENQLSQVAPTKMMVKYLEDCNYNIVQELSVIDKEEIEEPIDEEKEEIEEKEPEERVNLLREFAKDCPNFIRFKELEDEKMKRKLTQKELNEMDKYWFINMYTGGTVRGIKETNLPTIALAYRLWCAKFSGNKALRAMRLEKKVLSGIITIEELVEKRFDKSQFAEIQHSDIIKVSRVLEVCKKLGLKHSNDTDTVITQDTMDDFYNEAHNQYDEIRKDMQIQDKRKDKSGEITSKQFTGLIKGCFSESEQSLCNLKVHDTISKQINGKQKRKNTYKLVSNGCTVKEAGMINYNVDCVNYGADYKYDNLIYDDCARDLYDNMDIRERDEGGEPITPLKRLLKK